MRWLLLICLAWILWTPHATAQVQATVRLSPPITDQFPTVRLFLTITDVTGRRIPGLASPNFEILEDDVRLPEVSVEEVAVGTRQVFAINTSENLGIRDSRGRTRYDLVRESLLEWWSLPEASLQGDDDLSLLTTSGVLLSHTLSTAELASVLDHLEPTFGEAGPGLDVLLQALEVLSDPSPRPGMPGFVLFVTPLIEVPPDRSVSNVISLAQQSGTAIHTILVGNPEAAEQPEAEILRRLAGETGGEFTTFDQETGLTDLAQRVLGQRLQYSLTYSSRVNRSGAHSLQVRVSGDGLEGLSETRSFEIDVRPPEVVFIRPPNEILRQPDESNEASQILMPLEEEIRLLITFVDAHERPLRAARLLVDGQVVMEAQEPPYDSFTWDLTEYLESGDHTIQAVVEDALGLEGSTVLLPVRIEVIPPPQGLVALRPATGSLIVALGILVAGVVLAVTLLFSGRITRPLEGKRIMEAPALNRFRRAGIQRPPTSEAIEAFLVPILETGSEGKAIPLTGVDLILGRDASLSPHPVDDPSVSGLHARLIRKVGGEYVIRDQDSVAGTWVNYQTVPEAGTTLRHEDLIHIGRTAFRFRLSDTPPPAKVIVRPAAESRQEDSAEETEDSGS